MFVTIHISNRIRRVTMALLCVIILAVSTLRIGGTVITETPSALKQGIALPIVMYHGFSTTAKRQGDYILSPSVLESDLKYLKENGYTTIVMSDLLAYVDDGTPLPEKPIMLTFDDGFYSNYTYAYPLMKQYDSRMVLSPIGYYVDQYTQNGETNPEYATCHWETLREMMQSGHVEIQNHTYNLHKLKGRKGAKKLATETLAEYEKQLSDDLTTMQQRVTEELGVTPTTFTYPFGAVSQESLDILKALGFRATLLCESRVNYITDSPDCLYGLGRYIRKNTPDSQTFFEKIQQ